MSGYRQERLDELFKAFRQRTILVVGDVMLDRYIFGKVKRISPEAPVPVVEVQEETARLGGAANVANNLSGLGARALLIGAVGSDSGGAQLRQVLGEQELDDSFLVEHKDCQTICKTRVMAVHQQVVRIDHEKPRNAFPDIGDQLLEMALRGVEQADAVILSDYDKGLITHRFLAEFLPVCRKRGLFVAVDPKIPNFWQFKQVSLITPNHVESQQATGISAEDDAGVEQAARNMQERLEAESVLITRGEKGMSLFERGGKLTHFPTLARDVYDVTGAGDTVIATVTLTHSAGGTLSESCMIANHAASIVVSKVGTTAIKGEELRYKLMMPGSWF